MLSNTLNTNEVKNSGGTEVEFSRLSTSDRKTEFAQIAETPSQPHRLTIQHSETGVGSKKRRRSVVRVDKTTISGIDLITLIVSSAYLVIDYPVGGSATSAEMTNVVAELLSFCASTGASTTILYNGTGNGADALINGGL